MTKIWYKDILGFLNYKHFSKFYPSKDLSTVEKINSIVRFSIYFSVIHYIILREINIFSVVVVTMILTYIYYNTTLENYMQFEKLKNKGKHEAKEEVDIECETPDDNNPFMNVMMDDYKNNPNRKEACDVDDEQVKEIINKKFFKDTYRDIDDVFDRKSSFRNFYTNPVTTIPNDQKSFAESLYLVKDKTLKEANGNRNMYFAKYY